MLPHLLTDRGISHALAARAMGITPSTVSDIRRGKRGSGRKHIEAFATDFHVSPAVLLPEPLVRQDMRNERRSCSPRTRRWT